MDASKAGIKVAPFCEPSQDVVTSKHSVAPEALEAQMNEEMKVKFAECLAEGYDLVDDPFYIAWRGLKSAVISEWSKNSTNTASNPIPQFDSLSISSAFKVFQSQLKERK